MKMGRKYKNQRNKPQSVNTRTSLLFKKNKDSRVSVVTNKTRKR